MSSALQGAVESGAPVSRLHEQQSRHPADFAVPTRRQEERRFTPLRRLLPLAWLKTGERQYGIRHARCGSARSS